MAEAQHRSRHTRRGIDVLLAAASLSLLAPVAPATGNNEKVHLAIITSAGKPDRCPRYIDGRMRPGAELRYATAVGERGHSFDHSFSLASLAGPILQRVVQERNLSPTLIQLGLWFARNHDMTKAQSPYAHRLGLHLWRDTTDLDLTSRPCNTLAERHSFLKAHHPREFELELSEAEWRKLGQAQRSPDERETIALLDGQELGLSAVLKRERPGSLLDRNTPMSDEEIERVVIPALKVWTAATADRYFRPAKVTDATEEVMEQALRGMPERFESVRRLVLQLGAIWPVLDTATMIASAWRDPNLILKGLWEGYKNEWAISDEDWPRFVEDNLTWLDRFAVSEKRSVGLVTVAGKLDYALEIPAYEQVLRSLRPWNQQVLYTSRIWNKQLRTYHQSADQRERIIEEIRTSLSVRRHPDGYELRADRRLPLLELEKRRARSLGPKNERFASEWFIDALANGLEIWDPEVPDAQQTESRARSNRETR